MNVSTKFEVRSFTGSWDDMRYPKNLGSPWIRPRCLFSEIFNGLLFGWTDGVMDPANVPAKFEVRSFSYPFLR